ncbi:MAG: hypothetical protein ACE5GD_03700 [Candidatus Geothermarchaeales archaeon]
MTPLDDLMKRITIAIDEETYRCLVDYAAERSKREMRRFAIGEAIRELLRANLKGKGKRAGR